MCLFVIQMCDTDVYASVKTTDPCKGHVADICAPLEYCDGKQN